MKALTIAQPYAELILRGEKRIENRSWATNYRGRFYVHAGMKRSWLEFEPDAEGVHRCKFTKKTEKEFSYGAVVGVVTLVDCVKLSDAYTKYPWTVASAHAHGPWCWMLESPAAIGPWPIRGKQGWWEIADAELNAIANKALEVLTP